MAQVNIHDKRSQKTRKAIKNAFVELLSKQRMETITIAQVARLADINRKTFYTHYSGIKEVMDEIEDHVIQSLQDMFDQTDVIHNVYDPHFIFDSLSEVLRDDPQYYQYLLNAQSHNTLLMKLKSVLKPRLISLLIENFVIEQEKAALCVEFILSGTIALYQQWLDGERTTDIEEVSSVAYELATAFIDTLTLATL